MSRDRYMSMNVNGGGYSNGGGYRQGNQYAQQDNYYSSNGYQSQAPAYPQQAYTPSRNGGYSNGGGYTNTNGGYNNGNGAYGNGYNARNEYEMNNYSNGAAQQGENPLSAFFAERSEVATAIDTLNANITRIDTLQTRSLNDIPDDPNSQRTHRQIDSMMAETNKLTNSIRAAVKDLEGRCKAAQGSDQKTMITQTEALKKKFRDSITRFQQVEKSFRDRTRVRMERQLKIVKPNASQQEIQAAIDDDQGNQIFSQALMTSSRHGEARSALREVQSRHEDIKRIERTITELAQLFNEMSIMIEVQETMIDHIEAKAQETEVQMEQGLQETERAVVSARAARKKKWWCIGLIILIIVVIVVVLLILKYLTNVL